jgi:hypothetical protein
MMTMLTADDNMHGHARQELQAQLEETIQALRAVGMQN